MLSTSAMREVLVMWSLKKDKLALYDPYQYPFFFFFEQDTFWVSLLYHATVFMAVMVSTERLFSCIASSYETI